MIVAITGTSRGVGRALSEHLSSRGDQVFGCSRSGEGPPGAGLTHVQADLTAPDGPRSFFRHVRHAAGQLDALVNNAGASVMNHFMLMPEPSTRQLFDLNFHALIACCREAAALLAKSAHPSPCILNFSSVAVPWAIPGQLAYAATKSAVEQATRVMSRELAPQGIRVNALGLPPIRTALTRTVARESIEALIQRQAIKRQCEFEDIAGPVEFLLSPAARFVTGETLYLGGVH
jgi:3-oxoacyl-[acyl-carrier protein] reductase